MARIILFNKPYLVLSQFTDPSGRSTLADYILIKDIYAAGRLDYDSEGLLILTDSGRIQYEITDPEQKLPKTYWVQVEGTPSYHELEKLEKGVNLKDGLTRPATIKILQEPRIWLRNPPIRYRKEIPTTWLSIMLREGRKRQVRRMTAAVGFPTLRLIRVSIGKWELGSLQPGEWIEVIE
jgi:23S rRNA pseudouridine2457 synthase